MEYLESPYQGKANETFISLCDEIDYWRDRAIASEEKYKKLHIEYMEAQNQRVAENWNTIGTLFKVMLNSEQTEEGILIKQNTED